MLQVLGLRLTDSSSFSHRFHTQQETQGLVGSYKGYSSTIHVQDQKMSNATEHFGTVFDLAME